MFIGLQWLPVRIGFPLIHVRIAEASQRLTIDNQDLVIFTLSHVSNCDKDAGVAARMSGNVLSQDRWWSHATATQTPTYVGHGTTAESAVSVLIDGGLSAGNGICGNGIYVFSSDHEWASGKLQFDRQEPVEQPLASQTRVKDDAFMRAVAKLWKRTKSGQYNKGACFIGIPHAISVHGEKVPDDMEVPPGVITNKSDQWCIHPSSFEYVALVVDEVSFLHVVDRRLATWTYSAQIHAALRRIEREFQELQDFGLYFS
jgi:hypothetical protein